MAATGYTPISLYYSPTTGNTPTNTNLVAGELAINTADGALFYKDPSNVVQTLAVKGSYTNPSGNVSGLVYFDGTKLVTNSTVANIGYNTSTNTLTTLNFLATGTSTLSGSSTALAALLTDAAEVTTISATAATGTVAFYPSTQSVLYYTTAAAANWTTNLTFSSGTTMDSALATGQSLTVAFLVTQGGTAYYNATVQVDGTTTGVTTKWQGGTAPTSGNANSVDVYTYTIIKTGSATFTVLASQAKFA